MRHIPPPIRDMGRFLAELEFVPEEDRADAVQESWLAFLAGGDVTAYARGIVLTLANDVVGPGPGWGSVRPPVLE